MKSPTTLLLFLFICNPLLLFSQDTTFTSKNNLGIRFSVFYNYKVIHYVPNLSLDLGQHNVYAGVQATNVLKPMGSELEIYDNNTYGVNFGYRYLFIDKRKKIVPFTQVNFSIYEVEYNEYQLGPVSPTTKKNLILENAASIGVNFNLIKHAQFFSGIGFGSFEGFFLMVDTFIPSAYVGLEYKF